VTVEKEGIRQSRVALPLDGRLAAGEDPLGDPGLAARARQLVAMRARRRIARSLERVCSGSPERARLSGAVPVDRRAVEVARPALLQLARALRSRASVAPRGVALARGLLTDPYSALYRPAYRDELYEVARETLFALGPNAAPARARTTARPTVRRFKNALLQMLQSQLPARRATVPEAALKPGAAPGATPPVARARSFNEGAHKLGDWAPRDRSDREERSEEVRRRFEALADPDRDVILHAGRAVLVLGALGVVYGDIGTSPLYAEQALFTSYRATTHVNALNVFGPVSLIFWALTIVVSVKYAGFIMRAHNRGDGGIMGLTALLQRSKVTTGAVLITLGIFGAGLFLGDGMITPAISVLGSVQGLKLATPALAHLVVPLSVGILIALFVLQRFGSGTIGRLFGPVMVVWFVAIGVVGLSQVLKDPSVLQSLSPSWGFRFLADHGVAGYLTLGGVVLAVTGAEALYADRGHFGASAIRLGWLCVAFPALILNYLGQGVLVLHNHSAARADGGPFYQMVPHWAIWPMLVLATFATIIASQAAISGSFSVAKQAVQLGFLPRLKVLHTSRMEGQIYVPFVNWILCVGVVAVTIVFGSARRLGDIYGVAVTGTFILDTLLFVSVARLLWSTSWRKLAPLAALFLTVEVAFFSSNIAKIAHGAWLSLVIGLTAALVMITWRTGQVIVTRNRRAQEGPLDEFVQRVATFDPPLIRVPGVAVFLNASKDTTPLALRAQVERSHALHERVVIVSVDTVGIPHVEAADRFTVQHVGRGRARISHVTVRIGYQDTLNVPEALQLCRKQGRLERNLDLEHASYFVSRITITPTHAPGMELWRKNLFIAMARNAASPIDHFGLPGDRTVIMGSQIML
jgi:KUP system potassium uptake protein